MATQITGKNIDLTDAIREYVEKKVGDFNKFSFDLIEVDVEFDRSTHHNKGEDVYHCRMNVQIPHDQLFAETEQGDLYAAIDVCQAEINEQLRKLKSKLDAKRREANHTVREHKADPDAREE